MNIFKGIALLGLASIAYKYRSEIASEVQNITSPKKSLRESKNNSNATVYTPAKPAYSVESSV